MKSVAVAHVFCRNARPSVCVSLREGDGNAYLLSAYYVPDALLGVFLKFPDHGRPERL